MPGRADVVKGRKRPRHQVMPGKGAQELTLGEMVFPGKHEIAKGTSATEKKMGVP